MFIERPHCSALILAPLEEEIECLVDAFKKSNWKQSEDFISDHFFHEIYEFTDHTSENNEKRTVIIIRLQHQGVMNAGIDTWKSLSFFDPVCVISFGIAGGLEDVSIGDVIFATNLFYYEPAKYKKIRNTSTVQSRMDPISINTNPWDIIFRKLQSQNDEFKMHAGPFASGEKLFADSDAFDRKRIGATNDKILGVDMESAGVGRAASTHNNRPDFFLVKGISDMADSKKNDIDKYTQEMNRKKAAANAATVLVQMLTHQHARFTRKTQLTDRRDLTLKQTEEIINSLSKHGISANTGELYRVIYGRNSRVPAYFHWVQYGSHLNWIDFKILCAMTELPKEIIYPVPIVTVDEKYINAPWRETVQIMLGNTNVVTDKEIAQRVDELGPNAEARGLSMSMQWKILDAISVERNHSIAQDTLTWIMYMLGHQRYRRLIIFAWDETKKKWDNLIWAYDALYAVVKWDTFKLGDSYKKHEQPVSDICIDRDMKLLNKWLDQDPPYSLLRDFINHFSLTFNELKLSKCKNKVTARDTIMVMQEYWKERYFKNSKNSIK